MGVLVTVVSKPHDNVWICEYNGDRFPCSPSKLGETKPTPIAPLPPEPKQKKLTPIEKLQIEILKKV